MRLYRLFLAKKKKVFFVFKKRFLYEIRNVKRFFFCLTSPEKLPNQRIERTNEKKT